jgi:hypothetical protein
LRATLAAVGLLAAAGAPASGPADAPVQAQAPQVWYTDIVSGPNHGGENGKGIYLSIFGKGFGSAGLGTRVRVFVGDAEVDNYRYLGRSKGRPDVQQISAQIGALGDPAPGRPLPVKVVVDGVASNADRFFTVNPGRIIFVDNVKGNDYSAVIGDPARPFRRVQTEDLREAAWGRARPGDFIVLRGSGKDWQDLGAEGFFLRFRDKSGAPPTGAAGSGPISVLAYPGEDVFVNMTRDVSRKGAFTAIDGLSYPGLGAWAVIAGLRIEGGGDNGAINLQIHGDHWRIVNNEITAASAQAESRAGGVAGNGTGIAILGNHIHDVGGNGQENHGVYIDGNGSYEIAYNRIEDIRGGNGIQIFANGTNGSDEVDNVSLHHNLIRGVHKHGLNVADGARNGIDIYDNVIVGTNVAGLRFNTMTLHACRVWNNTFADTDLSGNPRYAALMNDWNLPSDALDMRNNIFVPSPGTPFVGGSVGMWGRVGTVAGNLWWSGRAEDVAFDAAPIRADPRFAEPGRDFHPMPGSAAIAAGSPETAALARTDFDGTPRGTRPALGAYEPAR